MKTTRRTMAVCALATALALAGCGSSNETIAPSPQDAQAGVQEAAPAAALAAPEADAATTLASALLDQLTSPSAGSAPENDAAPRAGVPSLDAGAGESAGAAVALPQCPTEFDLGNGITGTCAVAEDGTITFQFGGTVDVHGLPTTISGSMTATAVGVTPTGGTVFNISLSASATNANGSASWSVTGQATTDANGSVVDHAFNLSMTVTPAGGSSRVVVVHATPLDLSITRVGPAGHVVKFDLDRATMTGTVQVDGHLVANVTIADGCASIDYVNPALTDETICSQQAS